MKRNATIFFFVLLLLALSVIVFYRIKTDPFQQTQRRQQATNTQESAENFHGNDPIVALYAQNCSNCHGQVGEGLGSFPSLQNTKLSIEEIKQLIRNGKGDMPPFPGIKDPQLTRLAEFVKQLQ